ncbi:base excision DNA repair protein [Dioszegia hungarica]|uniref:Base excision DNA repair protein n=1 Tax=Dioszegia hungarica TaxID=4972 RepID=A0AA38HDZ8_9TREE|nr:base excision DNA repair protein [Dioszegia hungarica]KAI9638703.1 base excision DNA repair protein [Dioszegia hungarica]
MTPRATRAAAQVKRSLSPAPAAPTPKRTPKRTPVKREPSASPAKVKAEPIVTPRKRKAGSASPLTDIEDEKPTPKSAKSPATLRDRKLNNHTKFSSSSIFPTFLHPTPEECKLAHSILSRLHGERIRPAQVVASKERAGCGDSPSVLDALVRTILSQNTSDANSTRAKLSMDAAYGGSDEWEAIVAGGQPKLEEAIRCGGLSAIKSKVILNILDQAKEKYGSYTLDSLHEASTEDAMAELLALKGVGPKTASCVLLFCLQRDDFAVDTHVQRITGLLGWHPKSSNREQTYAHLNERIPAEDKYGLHILFVLHGKVCAECKAGGRNAGQCELRRAFKGGVGVKEEEGEVKAEEVKGEELQEMEDDKKGIVQDVSIVS